MRIDHGPAGVPAGSTGSAAAAVLVGVALGAGSTASHALLLYTGRGFLLAAGSMIALSLLGLAAGLWVGAPAPEPHAGGGRWRWAILAYGLASVFAVVWSARPSLAGEPAAGALAVLLLLAHPAYTTGLVLAALTRIRRTLIAPAAVAGAAAGVLLAAAALIPRLGAGTIEIGAAALIAGAAMVARLQPHREAEAMNGKVVLVTGVGDRGQVGFTIARRFLDAGAKLVITARSATVHELARELEPHGPVVSVTADLTVEADATRLIETARERFGRLDALINVAGGLTVIKPLADTTADEWHRETARNAATVHLMCRAALPLLRESRGAIVNFASPAGARALANLGAYSAAKAAVIALTRALAIEERPNGVRVNAIAPGMIDTAQNRRSVDDAARTRWVTREEIADLALFLADGTSAAVSGETIHALGEGLR